ncbi:hypothetical protein M407DRAFT_243158 [Tulasnella calospora MUT 4182]|uniref:Uncharacterized protein n=1 Tax=Tulasnella calospora MUT 4182 TaxID=1051891 RepID=A0A0C3QBV8_9AGAM|nr:hypothetical protein M407DRAFT_243158 [Tulasnella calospora MUT 4182]
MLQQRMSLDSPESAKLLAANDAEAGRVRLRRRSTISAPLPADVPPPPMPSAPATTSIFNPATLPPAPVYNLEDEENLPSPFIKKGVQESKTTSGWRSGLGFKKKTSLLSLAAANSASAATGTSSSSASSKSSIPTGPSSKSSRASFAKAVKASEDAQKLLLRRVT